MQHDLLADQFQEERLQVLDDLVEVDAAGLHHLLAAEGEQLTREGGSTMCGAFDLLDVEPEGIAGAEAVQHQIRVAKDGGEHVVEVVRDAAGQPPHRFHLLGLPQLRLAESQRFLRLAALGQIADPGGEEEAVGGVDA